MDDDLDVDKFFQQLAESAQRTYELRRDGCWKDGCEDRHFVFAAQSRWGDPFRSCVRHMGRVCLALRHDGDLCLSGDWVEQVSGSIVCAYHRRRLIDETKDRSREERAELFREVARLREANSLLTGKLRASGILRDPIAAAVRRRIIQRDGQRCRYCCRAGTASTDPDERPWHVDHVIPVVAGGRSTEDNLVLACAGCNMSKGAKPVDVFLAGVQSPPDATPTEVQGNDRRREAVQALGDHGN